MSHAGRQRIPVARKKAEPILRFAVEDRGAPEVAQAISLAFAVMRILKATCWSEVGPELPYTIGLDDQQLDLLNRHGEALGLLRNGVVKSGVKTTGVVICPACRRWMLVSTAVTTCAMKFGCPGKPVRIKAARKIEPGKPSGESTELDAVDDEPDSIDVPMGYDADGDFD
jgi:hypothetical protein